MLWRFGSISAASFVFVSLALSQAEPARAEDFKVSIPIDCDLGGDCFVQNYVDIDPSADVLTVACNQASYDGHKGTDFRVLDTKKIANVVASAPGNVKAVRDEMPDKLVLSDEDRKQVSGMECGNGVLIDHGNGWETQYCHMRQGSVRVAKGDSVERGQKIGEVGFSGFAAFPHVHLSVRKDGETVDPFLEQAGRSAERLEACKSGGGEKLESETALWLEDADRLLEDAEGKIIQTGFADGPVSPLDLETGKVKRPSAGSAAFVFFGRLINLQEGDRVGLRLEGPQGVMAETEGEPVNRQKAQWVAFSGRKLKTEAWPDGEYTGTVTLIRNGEILQQQTGRFRLGS